MKNNKTVLKVENKKPICEFKNKEELDECLKWWQNKLFLNDWVITVKIIPLIDFAIPESCGENHLTFETKVAQIHLMDMKDSSPDSPIKYCQEKVLVHELLHCKYDFLMPSEGSYEGKYLDAVEHQKLDDMAKTLMMVKYDLDFNWFKN